MFFILFQALFSATFILNPADIAFSDFLDCADLVYEYARLHDNWGNPVLPQPPGCPALVSDGGEFQDGEKNWGCVDV